MTFRLSDLSAARGLIGHLRGIEDYIATTNIDPQLKHLVKLRVSQINGCAYCLHVHTQKGIEAGLDDQRRGLVSVWREAEQVYSEQERAALELAEAVTQLPELEELQVAQLSSGAVLSPEQYSAVQWLAITMNVTNRISILSHHPVRPAAQKPGSTS